MTMDRKLPSFQLGDRAYFKNKQPRKWDLKWRPRCMIACIEHNGHYLHIENQAMGKTKSCNVKDIVHEPPIKFWNISTQFGKTGKYTNYPANLPTIKFNNWRWTLSVCKWSPVNNLSPTAYCIFFRVYFSWECLSVQHLSMIVENPYYLTQYWRPTEPIIHGSSLPTFH